MQTVGRKYLSVDLMKLKAKFDSGRWNQWLTACEREQDIEGLKKVFYGIQCGMDDLVKQGLHTDDMKMLFIRWQRSIENTAKKIWRKKYPNPLDNPIEATQHRGNKSMYLAKKKRDADLERTFKRWRF